MCSPSYMNTMAARDEPILEREVVAARARRLGHLQLAGRRRAPHHLRRVGRRRALAEIDLGRRPFLLGRLRRGAFGGAAQNHRAVVPRRFVKGLRQRAKIGGLADQEHIARLQRVVERLGVLDGRVLLLLDRRQLVGRSAPDA